MASLVSRNHKKLIEKVRRLFPDKEILGWPDAEVNLGKLCGLSRCNLRADIFIWWDQEHTRAVVIEYQSEIHSLKKANDWHDPDEIAGRDELKKEIVSRIGAVIVEITPKDMKNLPDEVLTQTITTAAEGSWITGIVGTGKKFQPAKIAWRKRSFESSSKGFKTKAAKLPGTRFKKKI